MGTFIIYAHHQISLGRSNQGDEVGGHVARMGEDRKVYRILVGKPEGKRPFKRQRGGWENWIRMYLRQIGWGCLEWIHLAQDRDQ
jgi:hypothetical protein